jgi:hypothetical protein
MSYYLIYSVLSVDKYKKVDCYCYGAVSHKASHALRPSLICVIIIPLSPTKSLWQLPEETPSSEVGETWREMTENFVYEVSRIISKQ